MFDIGKNRNVVILRPAGIAPSDIMLNEEQAEENDDEFLTMMVQIIKHTRRLLLKIAKKTGIKMQLYEYDLPPITELPSYAAKKWILQTNMIGLFNPSDSQLAFAMACLRSNPVMSIFLSCTDESDFHKKQRYCDTKTVKEVTDAGTVTDPRIFSAYVICDHEDQNINVMRDALLFPYRAA